MTMQGGLRPTGTLGLVKIQGGRRIPLTEDLHWDSGAPLRKMLQHGIPQREADPRVNAWREQNLRRLLRGVPAVFAARQLTKRTGIPTAVGSLYLRVFRGDGRVEELGLAGLKVVTTAGVGFLVDAWQNIVELENMKFHAYGTGSTAEATGDTALVTELTTEYNPNSTRPTGSTTEGASANIFRSVGTLTPDSGTPVLREHGLMSQAATGGGVLWDRTVFAAVTLDSGAGDSLQTTYDCTVNAGG